MAQHLASERFEWGHVAGYGVYHSPDDRVCPYHMAQQAEKDLKKAGAEAGHLRRGGTAGAGPSTTIYATGSNGWRRTTPRRRSREAPARGSWRVALSSAPPPRT